MHMHNQCKQADADADSSQEKRPRLFLAMHLPMRIFPIFPPKKTIIIIMFLLMAVVATIALEHIYTWPSTCQPRQGVCQTVRRLDCVQVAWHIMAATPYTPTSSHADPRPLSSEHPPAPPALRKPIPVSHHEP